MKAIRNDRGKAECRTKAGSRSDTIHHAVGVTTVAPAPAAVEIETERLRLRRFIPSDLGALSRLMGDPAVMRHLGREAGQTLSPREAEELLAVFTTEWGRRGFGRFALIDRASGELIGLCGWKTLGGAADTPELVYLLGKEHWGRGLAVEAAAACLRYGFAELGMERVVALTRPEHSSSRRVLEKLGMRGEGEGVYYGVKAVRYGVTREEFRPAPGARRAVRPG